jgi:hypothetical protein
MALGLLPRLALHGDHLLVPVIPIHVHAVLAPLDRLLLLALVADHKLALGIELHHLVVVTARAPLEQLTIALVVVVVVIIIIVIIIPPPPLLPRPLVPELEIPHHRIIQKVDDAPVPESQLVVRLALLLLRPARRCQSQDQRQPSATSKALQH